MFEIKFKHCIPGVEVDLGWCVVAKDPLVTTGNLCMWWMLEPPWLTEGPPTEFGLQILEFSTSSSSISSGLLPALLDNLTLIRLCRFRCIRWKVWKSKKWRTFVKLDCFYKSIKYYTTKGQIYSYWKVLTSQRDRGATSSVPEPGDVWLILLLHPGDPGIIPCWPPPIGDFIAWREKSIKCVVLLIFRVINIINYGIFIKKR